MAGRILETKQVRTIVHVRDRDVNVSIVVEVGEGRAATGLRHGDRVSQAFTDIGETAGAEIAIDDLALLVTRFGLELNHFRINVAVGQKQIQPAVVVEVDPARAPSQPPRVDADSSRKRPILAVPVARVGVERRRVAGEIRFEHVHRPVAIVVADGDAHAGLRLPVLTVRAAARHADVGERAVAIVAVQCARVRIVRDIEVDPAVVVEVERAHAQAVCALRARDPRLLGHIVERAVAGIVVQHVFATGQPRRAARHLDPFVATQPRVRRGRGGQIEIDVVGDEEVEPAVAIVIEERAAGAPACARAGKTRAAGHFFERPVCSVAIQPVLSPVADEQIVVPVGVVVADARPLSPSACRKSRLRRHVFERAVALVPVQLIHGRGVRWKSFEGRAVHEKQVEPAVLVVIDGRDAGAGGLEQVFVGRGTAEHRRAVEARGAGDVAERKTEPGRLLHGHGTPADGAKQQDRRREPRPQAAGKRPDHRSWHGFRRLQVRAPGAAQSGTRCRDSASAPLRRSASAS